MANKSIEKKLETNLFKLVKKLGGYALKFFCLSFTGMPDRIVLMPGGRIWFVEVKDTGKKPSPRQEFVIGWLRKLGFEVWIIDSEEKLNEFEKRIAA
jgi:hypothetical protein